MERETLKIFWPRFVVGIKNLWVEAFSEIPTFFDEKFATEFAPTVRQPDFNCCGLMVMLFMEYWDGNLPGNLAKEMVDLKKIERLRIVITRDILMHPDNRFKDFVLKSVDNMIEKKKKLEMEKAAKKEEEAKKKKAEEDAKKEEDGSKVIKLRITRSAKTGVQKESKASLAYLKNKYERKKKKEEEEKHKSVPKTKIKDQEDETMKKKEEEENRKIVPMTESKDQGEKYVS